MHAPASIRVAAALLGASLCCGNAAASGRLTADVAGNRLFLAAQEQGALEVFELSSGKHLKTVRGLGAPRRVLYLPDRHRIVVIDGVAGMGRIVSDSNYRTIDTIPLLPGADAMAYDSAGKMMYVVAGGGRGNLMNVYLYRINPRTGQRLAELRIGSDHVTALAIEHTGQRLYALLPGSNEISVINKTTLAELARWQLDDVAGAAVMTLDEDGHRLFVAGRGSTTALAIDTADGRAVATIRAPAAISDMLFDRQSHRLYLAGGGYLSAVRQNGPASYAEPERRTAAAGAVSLHHVPELQRLFIVPPQGLNAASFIAAR